MKSIIYTLLAICFAANLSAQSETTISKKVADTYQEYFNAGRYEAIFEMFGAQMKNALPLANTKQFLADLKAQAGAMKSRTFLKYENGTVATYRAEFENIELQFFLSTDASGLINGMLIREFPEEVPAGDRNTVSLILPFKGEWTIFWGGNTREQNYHVDYPQQKTAFDIIKTDENNRSYKTNGQTNEDYYAFGQEIIAPATGVVVAVVDGIKDNTPGEMNTLYIPGNTVIIKTAENEYLFFAHFKQNSIIVKEGQQVSQGDLLGLCGNSGNSSEPHLHFQVQNVENISKATAIKAFFSNIKVDGKTKQDYSPVKGERVSNM